MVVNLAKDIGTARTGVPTSQAVDRKNRFLIV